MELVAGQCRMTYGTANVLHILRKGASNQIAWGEPYLAANMSRDQPLPIKSRSVIEIFWIIGWGAKTTRTLTNQLTIAVPNLYATFQPHY